VLGLACGELVARAILGEQAPLLDVFDPDRIGGVFTDGFVSGT
jgi:hypothetical protein